MPEWIAAPEDAGARLDAFLAGKMEKTRSSVQKLIEEEIVRLNGAPAAKNARLREGDRVEATEPPPEVLDVKPQNIPLDIVYEDQDLLVVNKPKGMVVHPAAGNPDGTLVNALLFHCGDSLSGINGVIRPGIVHRIDKDTSGLLIVAKSDRAHQSLAEQIAGSESAFVEKMNRRAQELGMKDTHFCNCNGLPAEGHVTSAYDIALMSRQLLQYDLIRDYVGIWMDSIREGTFQLANTNKLIYYYDGATGLKTGSTDAAGYCISASAQREGMELIAVVLGSPTSKERFNTAKALLNYGFGAYALADVTPEQPLPALPVQLGQAEQVELALAQTGKLLVKKEERSKVTSELQLEQALKAPVSQGQEVGKLVVSVDGKERMTIPVVTQTQVPRLTFSGMFGSLWRRMATGK